MPVRTALSARDQMHADRIRETIAPPVGPMFLGRTLAESIEVLLARARCIDDVASLVEKRSR